MRTSAGILAKLTVASILSALSGHVALADCTVPLAVAGQIQFFNPDLKFCDGTNWQTISLGAGGGGAPGGADTQLQFNDGGGFGGDTGLVWNKTNKALTLTSSDASALAVGPNGATNPTFQVDTSATKGVKIRGNGIFATGSGNNVLGLVGDNSSVAFASCDGCNTSALIGQGTFWVGAAVNDSNASNVKFKYGANYPDINLTSGVEAPMVVFDMSNTRTHSTGALALQRDFRIRGTPHAFSSGSTLTNAAVFSIDGPNPAGNNATITNSSAIYVPSSSVSSGGTVVNSYGLNVNASTGATNNYAAVFNGGNVGVGTTNPGTALQVAGVISPSADNTHDLGTSALRFKDIYAANNVIQTSDARLKTEIKDSDLGLGFVNSLRPVSFYWKDGDPDMHYGVIAQETKNSVVEAKGAFGGKNEFGNVIVVYDAKMDRYGVRYTELIAPIIKAVQELSAENRELKHRLDVLTAYICAKDGDADMCN